VGKSFKNRELHGNVFFLVILLEQLLKIDNATVASIVDIIFVVLIPRIK
jgi:hypothetical protein